MSASRIEDIRAQYFCEETRWESWLTVEANLALAQGDLGIIPQDAARIIAEKATLSALDVNVLQSEIKQTMAPVYALTEVLAAASGAAGDYVHWGATTQNVIDTGRQIVLRSYHAELLNTLAGVLETLSRLAQKYANLTMVGRTNRQNALPITLGFKIAGWIDELLRVAEQMKEAEPRIFQLRFGGAVGGYHSLGADGPKVAQALAERLGLSRALVPGRTAVDPYIEYICKLSMIGVACGRIADELYLLMQEEIGELRENLSSSVVGSSTMPHKHNPKIVVELRARANLLRGKAGAVLTCSNPTHEADAATNQELLFMLEETCPLALYVLERCEALLGNITVCEDQIHANYTRTKALMGTEALMMRLARKIGRGRAHDLVHQLVEDSHRSGTPLGELVESNASLSKHFSQDDWRETQKDGDLTGLCAEIAGDAAKSALARAKELRRI